MKNTETKKQIRKYFLQKRAELCPEDRRAGQAAIADRLLASSLFRDARCIYIYISLKNEVDTLAIIAEAFRQKKRVAAPRVCGKHTMEFYFIKSMADLSIGHMGIREPGPWCPKAPFPQQDVLMVVPGTAFDQTGIRLGYGGGFYDTYLGEHAQCCTAGLAFSCQIAKQLPEDSHDVRIRYIFTEKEMITCF